MLIPAIEWSKEVLSHDDKAQRLIKTLRMNHLRYQNLKATYEQLPTVAVYGPSQVGKSYLVNVLLRGDDEQLKISVPNSDGELNLITDILQHSAAAVEKESSGIVTRFTGNQIYDNRPGFMFALMDEGDLFNMILLSYYNNNGDLKELTSEQIGDLVKQKKLASYDRLKTYNKGNELACILRLSAAYCDRIFNNNAYYSSLNELWEPIFACYDSLEIHQKVELMSVFWNEEPFYSKLYGKLLTLLRQLNSSKYIYVDKRIYLDDTYGSQHSVMGVARLRDLANFILKNEITDENNKKIASLDIITDDNIKVSNVNKVLLSYLIKEAIIYSSKLNGVDYLDFPGGRNDAIAAETENYGEELIRGKVKYLFQKYRDQYAFDNLIWCAEANTQQNTAVGDDIKPWVDKFIGHSAVDRMSKLTNLSHITGLSLESVNPLFYVITKYNRVIKGGGQ